MQRNYFSVVSSLLLLFTLIGFQDNLFTNIGQESNRDPKFVIHGLFCLAWMIVFAVQANLIRTGRFAWHQQVGMVGFLIAIGVTISTVYVFVEVWKPWSEMPLRAKANRILLPSYSLLMLLAWLNRSRPDLHKRMICMGTLYMLSPVLGRASGGVIIAFYIVWFGLFASMFAYDWIVSRKIHPVTYLGFGWFLVVRTVCDMT